MTAIQLNPHPKPSSNIHSIGHDAEKNELHVKFRGDGPTYVFSKNLDTGAAPDANLHTQWLKADSAGKFFHENIKGKFLHRKV